MGWGSLRRIFLSLRFFAVDNEGEGEGSCIRINSSFQLRESSMGGNFVLFEELPIFLGDFFIGSCRKNELPIGGF